MIIFECSNIFQKTAQHLLFYYRSHGQICVFINNKIALSSPFQMDLELFIQLDLCTFSWQIRCSSLNRLYLACISVNLIRVFHNFIAVYNHTVRLLSWRLKLSSDGTCSVSTNKAHPMTNQAVFHIKKCNVSISGSLYF